MGWEMIPWYTVTDSFDADFGVSEWHGTNVFFSDGDRIFRTYFINNRGDEQMGGTWNYLDITPLGARRSGRILPKAIRRPRPTSGGTGTTATLKAPRPTRGGSKCRTPERPRSGTSRRARSREPGALVRRRTAGARAAHGHATSWR